MIQLPHLPPERFKGLTDFNTPKILTVIDNGKHISESRHHPPRLKSLYHFMVTVGHNHRRPTGN